MSYKLAVIDPRGMVAYGKRKKRKMRGAGFGDFISGTLGGIGKGVGSGVSNLFSGLFGGKRKKRRSKRMRGGADVVVEAPTSLLGKLNKIAKDSKIISNALDTFGVFSGVSDAAKRLGYGKRRRRVVGRGRVMRRVVGGRASNLNF